MRLALYFVLIALAAATTEEEPADDQGEEATYALLIDSSLLSKLQYAKLVKYNEEDGLNELMDAQEVLVGDVIGDEEKDAETEDSAEGEEVNSDSSHSNLTEETKMMEGNNAERERAGQLLEIKEGTQEVLMPHAEPLIQGPLDRGLMNYVSLISEDSIPGKIGAAHDGRPNIFLIASSDQSSTETNEVSSEEVESLDDKNPQPFIIVQSEQDTGSRDSNVEVVGEDKKEIFGERLEPSKAQDRQFTQTEEKKAEGLALFEKNTNGEIEKSGGSEAAAYTANPYLPGTVHLEHPSPFQPPGIETVHPDTRGQNNGYENYYVTGQGDGQQLHPNTQTPNNGHVNSFFDGYVYGTSFRDNNQQQNEVKDTINVNSVPAVYYNGIQAQNSQAPQGYSEGTAYTENNIGYKINEEVRETAYPQENPQQFVTANANEDRYPPTRDINVFNFARIPGAVPQAEVFSNQPEYSKFPIHTQTNTEQVINYKKPDPISSANLQHFHSYSRPVVSHDDHYHSYRHSAAGVRHHPTEYYYQYSPPRVSHYNSRESNYVNQPNVFENSAPVTIPILKYFPYDIPTSVPTQKASAVPVSSTSSAPAIHIPVGNSANVASIPSQLPVLSSIPASLSNNMQIPLETNDDQQEYSIILIKKVPVNKKKTSNEVQDFVPSEILKAIMNFVNKEKSVQKRFPLVVMHKGEDGSIRFEEKKKARTYHGLHGGFRYNVLRQLEDSLAEEGQEKIIALPPEFKARSKNGYNAGKKTKKYKSQNGYKYSVGYGYKTKNARQGTNGLRNPRHNLFLVHKRVRPLQERD